MSDSDDTLPADACRLTLGSNPGSAALACALARAFAQSLGFTAQELDQIELGVEEAVSNVVRHAFADNERHHFEVIFQPSPLGLDIRIRDQGQPFDPTRVPEYDPEAPPDTQMQAGLGMHLIRRTFDEVEYRNLGRDGKETRLLKYRHLVPIGERPASAIPSAEAPVEAVSEVRLLRADDALDVSRCIHEAYGYSYPYEHIYFPERIVALNASGELCSAVAVTAAGRIAGHAALVIDRNTPDRAELAIVVTRMEYRGQGVARRIGDFLLDQARARGLRLLFTHAVTAHPYTQQFMHQLDFRDCALLPGHAPSSLRFRKIAETLPQRESCMLATRFLDGERPDELAIPVPPQHRVMLEAIYAHLGTTLRAVEPSHAALPPHADIRTSLHSGLELAILTVEHWGEDALEILCARLAQLRRERMAVIELQLPLCDPHSASSLTRIEAMGFVFSGVAPGVAAHEDRLILDFVADPGFDYDALKIHSPLGQRLRDYVRTLSVQRA